MGWEPFTYGEPLNPDKLNAKFNQVHTLLSKAYIYNNLLKRKLDTVNDALTISSSTFSIENDGTLTGDVSASRRLYDLPVAGNGNKYELFIGGEYFIDAGDSTDLTIVSTTLTSDGHSAILQTSDTIVDRIPLTTDEYGEKKPSLGTELISSEFDISKLYNILSPDSIWAEIVPLENLTEYVLNGVTYNIGTIDITLPDSLSPYMNKVSIVPLIGTSYRIFRHAGDGEYVIDNSMNDQFISGTGHYYLDRDIFDGRFTLQLLGTAAGAAGIGHGVINLEASYLPFADSGKSVIQYSLLTSISNINLTNIYMDQALGENISIEIYSDAALTSLLYNSSYDGFPFSGEKAVEEPTNGAGIDLYIVLSMEKLGGSTPALPYLQIKYEDTTI